jgi:hypothetical protein
MFIFALVTCECDAFGVMQSAKKWGNLKGVFINVLICKMQISNCVKII